jgi:nucleoside-diphosphate-sugar epimerase
MAVAIGEDVDLVCHLAALARVRPSLEESLQYLRANIEGTGVILERMRALGHTPAWRSAHEPPERYGDRLCNSGRLLQ